MSDNDTTREEGVDFGDVDPALEELPYPLSSEELIERVGDRELQRTNADPITIEELFGPMGEDTFESVEDVREMALSQMPSDSVGRQRYSDRGVSDDTVEGRGATGDESF